MAGRRRSTAGLAAGTSLIAQSIFDKSKQDYKAAMDRDAAFRDWKLKLVEKGISSEMEAGRLEFDTTSMEYKRTTPKPPDFSGLLGNDQNSPSPYQVLPKFGAQGNVTGYDTTRMTPEQQIQQEQLNLSRQMAPLPQQFAPEVQHRDPTSGLLGAPMPEAQTGQGQQLLQQRFAGLLSSGSSGDEDLRRTKLQQEIDAQARKVKAEQRRQQLESDIIKESALDALSTIDEVERGIQNFGLTGQLPSIPGTERAKWEANVKKLLSGKIVDLMAEMKRVSKTGATGFGQLNQQELRVLTEASTALKRTLSPTDAQEILTKMRAKLQKIAQSNPTDPTSRDGKTAAASESGVPAVGGMFNGEKVLSVRKVR